MEILVTGALGHIGSNLIRRLPDLFPGVSIRMVDNLATQRYCSLFDLPGQGRYRFFEADVLQADLEPLFDGVDFVIHLAAITDAANSFDYPEKVEEVNLHATRRVAKTCLLRGCGLIFPSSTSVYGTQADTVDESCSISSLQPQSPYADSKLKAEKVLTELAGEGLRHVTLRLGTIFGTSPGMRFHTAVNKFVWQACMGLPVTVWRTAMEQKRPYLDLRDAVEAFTYFMRRGSLGGETYNVLTMNATVREILNAIRAEVDDLRVELVDTRIMNQLSYTVLSRKIESLGFAFRGSLQEMIRESTGLLRNARYRAQSEGSGPGRHDQPEGVQR